MTVETLRWRNNQLELIASEIKKHIILNEENKQNFKKLIKRDVVKVKSEIG